MAKNPAVTKMRHLQGLMETPEQIAARTNPCLPNFNKGRHDLRDLETGKFIKRPDRYF